MLAPFSLLDTPDMLLGWSMFTKTLLDIWGDDGDALPEEDLLEKEVDGEGEGRTDTTKELVGEVHGQIARVPYPVLPSLQVHGLERKASLKGKQQRKTRQARMGRPTKPMNNWFWKFSSARGSGK